MNYDVYRKTLTKIANAEFMLRCAADELRNSNPHDDRTMELRERIARLRDWIGGSRRRPPQPVK